MPKISLNKLGEYLDSTPSRRRQIVKDQQDPQAFLAARYNDARREIIAFLEQGAVDDQGLLQAAAALRLDDTGSDFARQDRLASADAIEDFLDVCEKLDLEGLLVEGTDKAITAGMDIGGVGISIRPDALLKDELTGRVKGAIKLHFSKSAPLSEKSREYVATVLRVYMTASGGSGIDPNKCYAIDVPTHKTSCAPRAFKRKMRDVEAACEEIAARWN
ncbi:MAG: hypothetical protein ACT4PZ_13855 [Panacagrimonas sp.]